MRLFVYDGEFTINLSENGAIRYFDDNYPTCAVEIHATDRINKYAFVGLSLNKSHLESIIQYIDKTLNNEIVGTEQLKFVDPHVDGGHSYSPITFMIYGFEEHEQDYWQFNCGGRGGLHHSGENHYSICLNRKDIANLRAELTEEMTKIDWENHGKTWFYPIDLPDNEYEWCYSATDLESAVNALCMGKRLNQILVNLEAYQDRSDPKENCCYFFSSSSIMLWFDDFILDLIIHATGLFEYRILHGLSFTNYAPIFERNPGRRKANTCFKDIEELFTLPYKGAFIRSAKVGRTDNWPFSCRGFDESKLGAIVDLPDTLTFSLDNGYSIKLSGDSVEYFNIFME